MNYPRAPIPCPCHPPPQNRQSPITNIFEKFAIESLLHQLEPHLHQIFPENSVPHHFRTKESLSKILYWMFRSLENTFTNQYSLYQQILAIQQNKEHQDRILVESYTFFFHPHPIIFSEAEIHNKLSEISYQERMFLDVLLRNVLSYFEKVFQ
jgi:hypothetical protein